MARPVSISNDAILDAARRVFLKHGYQAGTAQVARAAGVSEGSLFKHFRTKEALFLAAMAVESQEQEWEARLMQSVGAGDIQATLADIGLQLLRHLQVLMPCVMMVNASGVTFTRARQCANDPPPLRLIRVFTRYFRAEVKAGRLAMAAPEMQAHAFVGAISHYVFCEQVFNYRSGPPAAYVRTVVGTILRATVKGAKVSRCSAFSVQDEPEPATSSLAAKTRVARKSRHLGDGHSLNTEHVILKDHSTMKTKLVALAVALAAGMTVLLSGCVSAPAPKRADVAWTPPAEALRADDVWRDIRALQPDLSRPLTLAEVTDLALRNNPATRKAWSEARAASAQVRQAEGYFVPTVTGVAQANRGGMGSDAAMLHSDYLSYGPGVQVSYLIFNFGGGRQAAVEQALQTVYAANFAFNGALQDAVLNAQLAYHGVVGAQAAVDAATSGVTDASAVLEAARTRLNAGLGVQLDVLQAQAGLDQARYTLADARGRLASARGLLAQALALPADTPVKIAAPTGDLPAELPETDMQRLTDEAMARRPDIAALRAARAARDANVKVTGSPCWPSLYFNGSLFRNEFDTYAGTTGDYQAPYAATLSLQWTLFDGHQTASAQNAALALAQAAREALRQAELAASADVWNRYQQYRTALDRHRFAAASLGSATASHGLAMDSYKAGLIGILDVLAADTQLAQARSLVVASRQDIVSALAQLARATGRLESGNDSPTGAIRPLSTDDKEHKP